MGELKTSLFDEFECIADRCTYSCCGGDWGIPLSDDEISAYSSKADIICGIHSEKKRMKMQENGDCYFLQSDGLCRLVLKYGPDILGKVCTRFPRMYNVHWEVLEEQVGNVCPEVLRILANTPTPFSFSYDESEFPQEYAQSFENRTRDIIIEILQIDLLPLWSKLYIAYSFAQKLSEVQKDGDYEAVITQYSDAEYLLSLSEQVEQLGEDWALVFKKEHEVFHITNRTSLKDSIYQKYIVPVIEVERELNVENTDIALQSLKEIIVAKRDFLENFCVNYAFGMLFCKEPSELKKKMALLIMEASLAIYTVFLHLLMDGEMEEAKFFDIFCYYARRVESDAKWSSGFADLLYNQLGYSLGDLFLLCCMLKG